MFYNIDTWWLSSPSSHSLVRKLVVGLGACMVLARRMDLDIGTPPRPAKSKSCALGGTATGAGSWGQSRGNHLQLSSLTTPGNTKGGSITVPLTSSLAGLDLSVLQIKTNIVSYHTADSNPVKQEVKGAVIFPPLVFPDLVFLKLLV